MVNKLKFMLMLTMVMIVLASCGKATVEQSINGKQIEENDIKENSIETSEKVDDEVVIELQGNKATIDGQVVEEFDYTWHSDPSKAEEWYEGTEPNTDKGVYIAHDIWYYPELNEDGFARVDYDGENEWAYNYTAEGLTDYIYATLPVQGENVPTEMMHSAKEARVSS